METHSLSRYPAPFYCLPQELVVHIFTFIPLNQYPQLARVSALFFNTLCTPRLATRILLHTLQARALRVNTHPHLLWRAHTFALQYALRGRGATPLLATHIEEATNTLAPTLVDPKGQLRVRTLQWLVAPLRTDVLRTQLIVAFTTCTDFETTAEMVHLLAEGGDPALALTLTQEHFHPTIKRPLRTRCLLRLARWFARKDREQAIHILKQLQERHPTPAINIGCAGVYALWDPETALQLLACPAQLPLPLTKQKACLLILEQLAYTWPSHRGAIEKLVPTTLWRPLPSSLDQKKSLIQKLRQTHLVLQAAELLILLNSQRQEERICYLEELTANMLRTAKQQGIEDVGCIFQISWLEKRCGLLRGHTPPSWIETIFENGRLAKKGATWAKILITQRMEFVEFVEKLCAHHPGAIKDIVEFLILTHPPTVYEPLLCRLMTQTCSKSFLLDKIRSPARRAEALCTVLAQAVKEHSLERVARCLRWVDGDTQESVTLFAAQQLLQGGYLYGGTLAAVLVRNAQQQAALLATPRSTTSLSASAYLLYVYVLVRMEGEYGGRG